MELVERAIQNSSKSRDTVLDSFAGSGTTLIACEKHGRQARLVELEPKYVDVVVRRWELNSLQVDGDGHSSIVTKIVILCRLLHRGSGGVRI